MSNAMKRHGSTVIPAVRYADAPAAIEWLCKVFGFEKHAVYPGPDGTIAHAQLTLGDGMVMLGSVTTGSRHSELLRQPRELAFVETQTPYVVAPDCDAVYARAKEAGAQIAIEIADMDYGGRAFTCRDPEGHLWSVGSYDPWVEHSA